jgi:hypothetical protein
MGASTLFVTSFTPSAAAVQPGAASDSRCCAPRVNSVRAAPARMKVVLRRVCGK